MGYDQHHSYLDLDTHADCAVLGNNCHVFQSTGRTVTVFGYDQTLGGHSRAIVSGCFAYDDHHTGQPVLLIVHQGLRVPGAPHSLIPPFQMRDNDIVVNDCPKSQCARPTADDHCLLVPRPDEEAPYRLPLSLRGTISCLPVRKPTLAEFADTTLERFELTYETPEWDHWDQARSDLEESLLRRGEYTDSTGDPLFDASDRGVNSEILVTTIGERFSDTNRIIASMGSIYLPGTLYQAMRDSVLIHSITADRSTSRSFLTPDALARNWGISLETARRTLDATTQLGIRQRTADLVRRFKTNDRALRYNRLNVEMYTDTAKAGVKSHDQMLYIQVYATHGGWVKAYPMATKADTVHTLQDLLKEVGVPAKLILDNSLEQTKGDFRKMARDAGIRIVQTEPHSPWQNYAESAIRELKKATRRRMARTRTPEVLWSDCVVLEAEIMSHTARHTPHLNGLTPQSMVNPQTPDISRIAEFPWYSWIWWHNEQAQFPVQKKTLGRYLGPTKDIGPVLTAKILKPNGKIVHRSSYTAVSKDELEQPNTIANMKLFTTQVNKALKEKSGGHHKLVFPDTPDYEPYSDWDNGRDPITIPDRDDYDISAYDPYMHSQVILPHEGEAKLAKVKFRKRDFDGNLIGRAAANPIQDTREYVVEFEDGTEGQYSANVIAQNMVSQVDENGNQQPLLRQLVGHRRNKGALSTNQATIEVGSKVLPRRTTKGWDFCVEWADGHTSWVPLSILKEQNPVEVAEYAVTHSIDKEAAFAWWVPWTLLKRDTMVSAVNKRYWKRTHKFGIRIPHSVQEAHAIDKEAGNTKWADAINKEMKNVRVAFKVIDEPPGFRKSGYQHIKCHLVFDIKMDTYQYKARMVAGGHMTETPSSMTYSSVVSRDSVRIALTIASLNDLQVKAGDIQNAYLTAPCKERITVTCGPEFGEDQGKTAEIVRALYGLKSSGAAYGEHLAKCMTHLGYQTCLADNDVWFKAQNKPDGTEYYAYVLIYVDDILVIHHDAKKVLAQIDYFFHMKPESMGDPDIYLGCKLRLHIVKGTGAQAWLQSPSKYIQEAVKNAEVYYEKEYNSKFPTRVSSPFATGYRPEMDITKELNTEEANYYQSQIGVLRWIVEIGRIDIITEVSLLASQMALPRMGHLMQVFRCFAYLKIRHNGCLVFDPSYPDLSDYKFEGGQDWVRTYGDVKEPVPGNAPTPRGKSVVLRLYVDSDHAGEELTRRSRTGYIMYMNSAPILWHSKRQGTVETSVFGAEFVAMKAGNEASRGLRYKLRMMGIPLDGPTYIFGDNMSVIYNTQKPESVLKKKSIAICYHYMRESVAMGECLTAHVRSEDNPADLCTKIMSGGQKRDRLVDMVLHYTTQEGKSKSTMSVSVLQRAERLLHDMRRRGLSSRPS